MADDEFVGLRDLLFFLDLFFIAFIALSLLSIRLILTPIVLQWLGKPFDARVVPWNGIEFWLPELLVVLASLILSRTAFHAVLSQSKNQSIGEQTGLSLGLLIALLAYLVLNPKIL